MLEKESIEKIESMAAPTFKEIAGSTFCIQPGKDPKLLQPKLRYPENLELTSLDGLVKMVKTEALASQYGRPLNLQIRTHQFVRCFSESEEDIEFNRILYYTAEATDIPGWEDKVEMRFDQACIALRTQFQSTPDIEYLLKTLSDITTGSKVTYNDNGVAQTVVTKTGVDLQKNQIIKPIVSLKPYRTFQEIEQPASDFLIRISERGITFYAADGGMWKLEARKTIKAYLEDALKDEIASGTVVVML